MCLRSWGVSVGCQRGERRVVGLRTLPGRPEPTAEGISGAKITHTVAPKKGMTLLAGAGGFNGRRQKRWVNNGTDLMCLGCTDHHLAIDIHGVLYDQSPPR